MFVADPPLRQVGALPKGGVSLVLSSRACREISVPELYIAGLSLTSLSD